MYFQLKYKLFFLIFLLILGISNILNAQSDSSGVVVDSTKIKKNKVLKLTSSELSVGYEYGFLPFSILLSPPDQNIKSTGLINFEIKELPFNASYYYSSLGFVSGINNHFKISFDANKYIQNRKEKLLAKKINRSYEIDSLNVEKQQLSTKLDYLQHKIREAENKKKIIKKPTYPSYNSQLPTNDSLNPGFELDSSKIKIPTSQEVDTDSLYQKVKQLENNIAKIDATIEKYQALNGQPSLETDMLSSKNNYGNTESLSDKIIGSIRTFEVGLTSPDYSEFLVNRTMVRGINTEFEKNNYYLAFTYGTAVNTILTSQLSQPNTGEQFYNFLSVKNVDSGRKITALKLGYGKKESTHLFVGGLYGTGKINYLKETAVQTETNLVMEVDGRIKLMKHHTLDLIYGRSATQVKSVLGNDETLLTQLFNFNNRTNALLSHYNFKLKGTTFDLKFRLIDPFYKSFGVQFIRNDNIRYEAKIKQKLGKKVTLGSFFRRENDNILGFQTNKNVLISYGADIAYRPTKKWLLKADYRPFVQQVNAITDTSSISNNNYIINSVVSYNNRFKKDNYLTVTSVYSYYFLSTPEGGNVFKNLNLNINLQFKDNITNAIIYNRFDDDSGLLTLNNILENDLSITIKKIKLTGIGKFAFNSLSKNNLKFGYGAKISFPIKKIITFELTGEKLLLGDFYSNLLNLTTNDFPYYFSSNLVLRF